MSIIKQERDMKSKIKVIIALVFFEISALCLFIIMAKVFDNFLYKWALPFVCFILSTAYIFKKMNRLNFKSILVISLYASLAFFLAYNLLGMTVFPALVKGVSFVSLYYLKFFVQSYIVLVMLHAIYLVACKWIDSIFINRVNIK